MSYFEDEVFEEIENSLELKDSEFIGCHFEGLNFSGEVARNARFIECHFKKCNLSNMNLLNSSLRHCQFTQSKLVGLNWSTCHSISEVSFDECLLNFSSFMDVHAPNTTFKKSSLIDCEFSQSFLKNSIFKGSDLRGANFSKADLSGCDFELANHYLIDPANTKIKGARFKLPEALSLFHALGVEVSY